MSLTGNGGNGGGTFENITKSLPQNLQMQSIHQPLNHQLPPPPLMPWPNHLMGAPPYLHTAAQHQQHMYNIHTQPVPPTASAAPSGQQESYSMLRMGNGNFLKIYHCAENALGAMPVEPAPFTLNQMYNQQSPQTHLQTAYHHVPQRNVSSSQQYPQTSQIQQTAAAAAAAGVSQMFNSYELFSSNTFAQLRTPDIAPLLLVGQRENATNDNDGGKPNHSAQNEINADHGATGEEGNANAANMIINNLVNNWSQNLTGGIYTQFGTQANSLQEEEDITSSSSINQTHGTQLHLLNDVPPMSVNQVQTDMISVPSQLHMDAHNIAADQVPHGSVAVSPEDFLQVDYKNNATDEVKLLAPISSSANSRLKQDIPRNQEAPKKRIVAEVKPMRMTYSDVLSKFNDTPEEQQQRQQHPVTNATQHPNNATANNKTNLKSNKIDSIGCNSSASNNRRNADESTGAVRVIPKKSPVHENKENVLNSVTQQVAHGKATSGSFTKRSTVMFSSSCSNNAATNASTSQKATQSQKKVTSAANNADASMKRRNTNSKKSSEKDIEHGEGGKGHISKSHASATVGSNNTSSYIGNACGRKTTRETNHSINNNNSYSNGTPSQQQQQQQTHRLRYQGNSNISYSYSSTKRSRNNNSINNNNNNNNNNANYNYNQCNANNTHNNNTAYVLAGGGGGNKHTPNYDLAKRFLMAWYACSMKLLTWLFYLIYDIIVLGCSILYDHLRHSCEAGCVYACHLYRDLKKNSNKPGIWLRNRWRYFDAYFTKNSKWAFWRRFYKKRPPEQINESNKNGRLPQTGEEAMYSLLNCKGKDAYSILGVPSNSSPEQIRKHYKKIAVLVHPDKNKQPGAEEAFKVLQRAFELIGEPENRLAYDHSLAEALHAEKAWTELHDLLSQLQTKITEAANTIRCSTCGLRHPRKLSDRPHYAARECASCKIRHSAREGDIWAETSMMGLRWKYLALMEGKVYDITAWANCQKGALAHLEPNSHMVQYRIVRGAQQQQRQQQKQQTNHPHKHSRSGHQNYGTGGGSRTATGAGGKFKCDNIPPSEASLHEFLDNLYSGQHPHNQQNTTTGHATSSRRRNRRN